MSSMPPSSVSTSTALSVAAARPPAWRKPVLITGIILVSVFVILVVLYFLNVLMPRYKCDATTGNCVGKYNGTYKNNTCDSKCKHPGGSGGGGATGTGTGTGYDCVDGICQQVPGGGYFGSDSGCGDGCYKCSRDNVGEATGITTTAKKGPDSRDIIVADTKNCTKTYTCQGGKCALTTPSKGQFTDQNCGSGCNTCNGADKTCVPVADGMMTGYIADCAQNPDCGGPYSCVKNGDKTVCQHVDGGDFATLSQCNCDIPPNVVNLSINNMNNSWPTGGGNDGDKGILYNVMVKLGEFIIPPGSSSACNVIVNAGIEIHIGDGSGKDSMTASILVIDKDAFDRDNNGGGKYQFKEKDGNMIYESGNSGDTYNLFHYAAGVVRGGQIPNEMIIDKSGLPKIRRDSNWHDVWFNSSFVTLGPGKYWVVAYLGICTDDNVEVHLKPNSKVTFPVICK